MKSKKQTKKSTKKTTTSKSRLKKVTIDATLAKRAPVKKITPKIEKPESQYNMVFNHLVKHGSINTMEAIKNYGVLRLGALIFNLREGGVNIKTDVHIFTNKHGRKSSIAKYVLS